MCGETISPTGSRNMDAMKVIKHLPFAKDVHELASLIGSTHQMLLLKNFSNIIDLVYAELKNCCNLS